MAAKRYDPALKALVETDPASWPELLGRPTGPTEVVDADIATVSGAADKVLQVSATPPYLLHLEFVSGHDAVMSMKESSTYQAILDEGRAEGRAKGHAEGAVAEARKLLRRLGDQRYGSPDARTASAIESIFDLDQLEHLCDRLPMAKSWKELLGQARRGPRRRR